MRRLGAALLVVALAATGCGDDDDDEVTRVPLGEWATDVCGSFVDFAGRASAFVQEFGPVGELTLEDLPGAVGLLDALGQGLARLEADLAELGDELEASGVPDVDSGEDAVEAVTQAFDDLRARLQAGVDLVAELGPDDLSGEGVAEFEDRVREIAEGLGSLGDDLEADLPDDVRSALEGDPSCTEADDVLTELEASFVPD